MFNERNDTGNILQRAVAVTLMGVLLSGSVVPVIPEAQACKHAAERTVDSGCHSTTSSSHMHQALVDESEHDHHGVKQHETKAISQPHQHDKKLTASEKQCRIECGCGCHRSVDSLPTLFPPHLTPLSPEVVAKEGLAISVVSISRPLEAVDISVPTPPPKL
ncbi:MAG: hypothetical protein R8M38_03015 [Mariprofundaceae bacterium]